MTISDKADRIGLVNRKDLYNLLQDPQLHENRLHRNDMVSVQIHVERTVEIAETTGWNNIFDYHAVFDASGNGFTIGNRLFICLRSEYLSIDIMTKEQQTILLKYGYRGICADSTHNMIFVQDDHAHDD